MNKKFMTALFITSFLPLWIAIIFTDSMSIFHGAVNRGTEILSIVVIIILNSFSIYIIENGIQRAKTDSPEMWKIKSVARQKTITSEYLLSYILPLFVFDFTKWEGLILFLLYFITLAFLCIKNGNVYVNLLFELRGYTFYECEVELFAGRGTQKALIISRRQLQIEINQKIPINPLTKPVYLDVS